MLVVMPATFINLMGHIAFALFVRLFAIFYFLYKIEGIGAWALFFADLLRLRLIVLCPFSSLAFCRHKLIVAGIVFYIKYNFYLLFLIVFLFCSVLFFKFIQVCFSK